MVVLCCCAALKRLPCCCCSWHLNPRHRSSAVHHMNNVIPGTRGAANKICSYFQAPRAAKYIHTRPYPIHLALSYTYVVCGHNCINVSRSVINMSGYLYLCILLSLDRDCTTALLARPYPLPAMVSSSSSSSAPPQRFLNIWWIIPPWTGSRLSSVAMRNIMAFYRPSSELQTVPQQPGDMAPWVPFSVIWCYVTVTVLIIYFG